MPCQIFDLHETEAPGRKPHGPTRPSLTEILEEYPAARLTGFLDKDWCADIADRVRACRSDWSKDYGGEQHSYPNNFYARANDNGRNRYFERSETLNAQMERAFGAERARLLTFIRSLMPEAAVEIRGGWQGPAFVIFPADELLSREPGPIHIDLEGLAGSDLDLTAVSCFSVICMIQPPETGGGVKLWNLRLSSFLDEEQLLSEAEARPDEAVLTHYQAGDLLIINSLSPHQILQFGGNRDRITLNAFAISTPALCQLWF